MIITTANNDQHAGQYVAAQYDGLCVHGILQSGSTGDKFAIWTSNIKNEYILVKQATLLHKTSERTH